jgi:inosine-uridine nucleoside N-ribohydrolase
MTTPLIVDTDMAFDDWLALTYLVQSARVDLKAVTISATGEAHAGPGIETALRILQLNHIDVPVTSGRSKPLEGDHHFPLPVRLAMDFRLGISLPKSKRLRWSRDSKSLLIEQLQSAPDKVTILALAPLTNLGEVLLEYPELAAKIKMIYVMGGALNVHGNLTEMINTQNTTAEWNIFIDYYAADLVFRSGTPITLIPLDLTNQFPLTDAFCAKMMAEPKTPAADFAARVLKRLKMLSGKRLIYLWDLMAAVIVTYPELGGFEVRQLSVIQAEGIYLGRVVDDESGHAIRVCTAFDPAIFESIVFNTLNGTIRENLSPSEVSRLL